MTTQPPNSRPTPLDEGDLLAWVEGEPLPRDREKAVAIALGQDPALARRLEAMRADRKSIKALHTPAAPANLLAGVEAALQPVLERQMLMGLRDGELLSDLPPVSIVQPVKRSIVQTFLSDRVGRRLAVAAGLLLVVGGASLWATTHFFSRPQQPPLGPIAIETESRPQIGPAPSIDVPYVGPEAVTRPMLAEADPPAITIEPALTIAAADQADPSLMGPFLPELDGARAAELARENRLVIRITALDPAFASEPGRLIDRIRRADQNMLRLGEEPTSTMVAALNPSFMERDRPVSPTRSFAPAYAGSAPSDLPPDVYGPPLPPPEWNPPAPQLVYLVQARLDAAAMETLRTMLGGSYGRAEFEVLDAPLPDATPALNAASMLWWGQNPSGWTWWANIPVVIDTAR